LHGVSFVGLNALIMQRYMYEHAVPLDAFAGFSINAHRNGANNPNAMFQEAISHADYLKAPLIATPINIMDSSPVCDGAAALILVPTERVHEFVRGHHPGAVQILASASANDTLAVHARKDPLFLQAAWLSSQKALQQARQEERIFAGMRCNRPGSSEKIWISSSCTTPSPSCRRSVSKRPALPSAAKVGVWRRMAKSASAGGFPSAPWVGSRAVVIPLAPPAYTRSSRL
jgi:hypothetical protein